MVRICPKSFILVSDETYVIHTLAVHCKQIHSSQDLTMNHDVALGISTKHYVIPIKQTPHTSARLLFKPATVLR